MMLDQEQEALGKKLLESGVISAKQLESATLDSTEKSIPLVRSLVEAGYVNKNTAYEALAEIYSVPYVDLANFQVNQEAVQSLTSDVAHKLRAIPIFKIGSTLNVVVENPADVAVRDLLAQKTQAEIDICLGAFEDIETALHEYYGISTSLNQLLDSLNQERARTEKGVGPKLRSASTSKLDEIIKGEHRPVIPLVDMIFQQAYEQGASDIHIEPDEKVLRIRYRIDGVLHEALTPPKDLESEMISRVKILAGMDIAESRMPQDGRIKLTLQGRNIDTRVSSMPTVYGENIVIRILRETHEVLDLPSLGFRKVMQDEFERMIQRPYGMILETGPTGSGKTTTLYAALRTINTVERNIVTIEDPVEYKLAMLRQIPVNVKAGLTFATALRSILRQDPDVIMVGEIRDQETAEIAIQAALTGHLVFSTLHTATAASAVTRLVDMKIEPFLVASSVIGVISQRLVRRLCPKCKEADKPTELFREIFKVEDTDFPVFKPKGCRQCHQTGYKGRIGIFELLKMSEGVQKKILARSSSSEIEETARQSGFFSMREDAIEKIKAGETSAEEVMKAIDFENR